MDSGTQKKTRQSKARRNKAQELFAKTFPYRFSWGTEPSPEPPQRREAVTSPARARLPLQRTLVPTRSIPVPGLGAPDFTPPPSSPRPPWPPQCHLWELKLLSHRFPRRGALELALLLTDGEQPCATKAPGTST
uniref:Chromosome 3 open reading frame 22 n=1 Tax=Prolemur simus TaxID=1328070 RepID=A0A8C8YWF2_PROSS